MFQYDIEMGDSSIKKLGNKLLEKFNNVDINTRALCNATLTIVNVGMFTP